jgi:hypothetical protein
MRNRWQQIMKLASRGWDRFIRHPFFVQIFSPTPRIRQYPLTKPMRKKMTGEVWEISAPKNRRAFIRYLTDILPAGSVLFLEGGTAYQEVEEFLRSRQPNNLPYIPKDTLFPPCPAYHLPIIRNNLDELYRLMKSRPVDKICLHLKAYNSETILMTWHDVYIDDPWFLSKKIPEENLKHFCEHLSCEYQSIKIS